MRNFYGEILTVSLNPNFWVTSEVPATVSRQRATKASELLVSATTWTYSIFSGDLKQFKKRSRGSAFRKTSWHTSKTRLSRYLPPKESKPRPPKAFKLSWASIGQILSSPKFCIRNNIHIQVKNNHEREKERFINTWLSNTGSITKRGTTAMSCK